MLGRLRDPLFVVWLVLVAVTLVSATVGGAGGLGRTVNKNLVSTAVLVLAFGKVAAVMFTYMDIRRAPLALKLLTGAWLAIVLTVLMTVYWGGP